MHKSEMIFNPRTIKQEYFSNGSFKREKKNPWDINTINKRVLLPGEGSVRNFTVQRTYISTC